jgi:hypothetical protein
VKNVLSAGGCRLQTRGRVVELGDPQLVHDPDRRLVPAVVRVFLGLLGVNDFLRLRPVATTPSDRRP